MKSRIRPVSGREAISSLKGGLPLPQQHARILRDKGHRLLIPEASGRDKQRRDKGILMDLVYSGVTKRAM